MKYSFLHIYLLIGLLLGGLWLSRVQAQEGLGRSQNARPRAGTVQGTGLYSSSYALLIGIDRYPNTSQKRYSDFAEKDAAALRDMLVSRYGFPPENVLVLRGESATKQQITKALAVLADSNRVGSDDRVLIFFAGQTQTVTLANGSKVGYLVPQDAEVDLSRPENVGPYQNSCISMKSIWEALEACPARHRLLLLDACFGGLMAKSQTPNSASPSPEQVKTLLARPALQVITAGSEKQTMLEDANLGHSIFTHYLLTALTTHSAQTESVFTASNLASALKRSVESRAAGAGTALTPQFASRDTEGEVFFVLQPERKVAASDAKPPANAVPRNPVDGAELVWIPAGEFLMGTSPAEGNLALRQFGAVRDELLQEMPFHPVYLDGYWIYKTAVTVAQYRRFCEETGRQMPPAPPWGWQDNYPMTNNTLLEAVEYSRWARASLPTEAEWEKAARGVDGRIFPWGNVWDPTRCANSVNAKLTTPQPVGSYPNGASPYGVLDMAGNENERCADWYGSKYYQRSPLRNPTGPVNGTVGVVRGGAFGAQKPDNLRAAFRHSIHPQNRYPGLGFRCVIRP